MPLLGEDFYGALRFLSAERIEAEDIDEDSLILQTHAFWRSLAPAPALPARSDFRPSDIPREVLSWLFLMEVIRGADTVSGLDYRYRLNGTSNVTLVARDPTGKLASDIFTLPEHDFMMRSFDCTVEERKPTYWIAKAPNDRVGFVEIRRGLFPLAEDRENVDMLLCIAVPNKMPPSRE